MSLKVAIDSGPLQSGHAVRGIGVVVREHIAALKKYGGTETEIDTFDFLSEEGMQKLWRGRYDIAHYQHFHPFQVTLPDIKTAKNVVVTIHDLVQLIYPKKYPPGIKGTLNFYKQKKRLKKVDMVITVSETSKKDIVRFLPIPSSRISVVYNAPSEIYKKITNQKRLKEVAQKYHLPEKFALYLGDINYNKNIPTLIKACEIANIPLVIAGKHAMEMEEMGLLNLMDLSGPKDYIRFFFDIPHPEHAHYSYLLEKFRDKTKVTRLGYVDEGDVVEVMNLASVYVQPSFYEGFGLSVVHAFACETPVVVSRTNALTEIVGNAALVADPNEPVHMAEKITQVLRNQKVRASLIERGKARVKNFSWEKCAKDLLDVYRSLASNR